MRVFEIIGMVVSAVVVIGVIYLYAMNVYMGIKEDRLIRKIEQEQKENNQ